MVTGTTRSRRAPDGPSDLFIYGHVLRVQFASSRQGVGYGESNTVTGLGSLRDPTGERVPGAEQAWAQIVREPAFLWHLSLRTYRHRWEGKRDDLLLLELHQCEIFGPRAEAGEFGCSGQIWLQDHRTKLGGKPRALAPVRGVTNL